MNYKIPLFDLNYGPEEEKAVIKTLRSKWISMGPNVQELEQCFSEYLDIKYAVAVTNCTAALHLAMRILNIGEGDEVIVPSLTFVATVNAVRYVGASPVFADITSYEDLSIDPADIERKLTPKTKAIVVMHYGGFSCEMGQIMKIARDHNVFVIEDAAHAPGSEFRRNKLGTIGHIGCFSFFSNKNITCGEGGLLVTNDEKYAKEAKLMRAHGMTSLSYERAKGHATEYDVVELGYNYRMDDIRGALILEQLNKLNSDIEKREELRSYYIDQFKEIDEIIIPYRNNPYKSSNYIFPIVLKSDHIQKRNGIRQQLAEAGIQTSIHYPAVHKFTIYESYKTDLPKTEYVTNNEITLPMYSSLKKNDVDYICSTFKRILEKI